MTPTSETHPRYVHPDRLAAGMVIMGTLGGTSVVYEAMPSDQIPGMWSVATEHGYLYVPANKGVKVWAAPAPDASDPRVSHDAGGDDPGFPAQTFPI